jgi:hypothetical protein
MGMGVQQPQMKMMGTMPGPFGHMGTMDRFSSFYFIFSQHTGMPQAPQQPQPQGAMQGAMQQLQPHTLLEESLIFSKLLRNGLNCFTIYSKAPTAFKQDTEKVL